jgi:hypothetical protein
MSVQHLGIMNALRTGNVVLDMLIAMCVPFAITLCVQLKDKAIKYFTRLDTVEYVTRTVATSGSSPTEQAVVQKAIMETIVRNGFVVGKKSSVGLVGSQIAPWYRVQDQFGDVETLKKFVVGPEPAPNTWTEVGPGVEILIRTTLADKVSSTEYTLRSKDESVDKWISDAYAQYVRVRTPKVANLRYMYLRDSELTYNQYELSDAKTFDAMFSPHKADIVRLVDDFEDKKGMFSNPAIPYKLGFLLHGPPGTGKTSMIKAMASYTKRHIVSVPLSGIETNTELSGIMFGKTFKGRTFEYSEIMFVLEDVDAAADVVLKRVKDAPEPVEEEDDKPKTLKKKKKCDDALNLAGVLNVIDGIVDTPGRMLVMTTNHPEKLDPALIRPGRVNMKICLGYMQSKEIIEMVTFYKGEVSPEQAAELRAPANITPAAVEQVCISSDTVDDVIADINNWVV